MSKTAEILWEEFKAIPVTTEGNTSEPFGPFHTGTPKFLVLNWFEDVFNIKIEDMPK